MNETLITDLVAREALQQLEDLDRAMEGTLQQFQDCARELARGIKIPVEVTGDIDRLREIYQTQMQRAGQATQQLTQQLQQQQQVIANTTNTISRALAEQEKLNKSQRAAFTQNQQALDIADRINGTYEQNTRQLAQYTAELARNKAELKKIETQRKTQQITEAQAIDRSAGLLAQQNQLKAAMQEVASVVRTQAKEMNAAEGSYVKISQQLELLKKAQKGLNEEEKASDDGKLLEAEIQNLDARLKDLAADMGEFQRNVGNYAIASGSLKKSYTELTEGITALTIQYHEMDDAERESAEGQQLKAKIDQLTEKAGLFKTAMDEVNGAVANSAAAQKITRLTFEFDALAAAYNRLSDEEKESAQGHEMLDHMGELTKELAELKGEVDAVAADEAPKSLKKNLRELQQEIAQLTLEYQRMSEEEKNSAKGQELKNRISDLTEDAAELKDVLSDVAEDIRNVANDTRLFNTVTDFGQLVTSTFGLCTSAAKAFGLSEEQLTVVMAKVQGAMQATQALEKLSQLTQRQSNLMRGISILQRKAEAAAINIKTAAEGKGIVATKAATVAQAAFNAVAKANPYVLLATAIIAVIGLIVSYTAATNEATEADKEAAAAADLRRESNENMAQSVGNSAGELLGKYKLLQQQWNALGDDIAAKEQLLKNNQKDFDNIAQAAYGAQAKVKDVASAEKLINQNTNTVEKNILRRARAMAAYAEYIRLTQMELQELEKINANSKYRNFKTGDEISVDNANELFSHGLGRSGLKERYENRYNPGTDEYEMKLMGYTVTDAGQATEADRRRAIAARDKEIEAVKKKYDAQRKTVWSQADEWGAWDADPGFRGGGSAGSSKSGKTNNKGGSTNKHGSSGSSNNAKTEVAKTIDEIDEMVAEMLYEVVKGDVDLLTKGTDEWAEKEKERIKSQLEFDKKAAEEKGKKNVEELDKSLKQQKITQEQYDEQKNRIEQAVTDIQKNLEEQAAEDKKAVDKEVADYKAKQLEKEIDNVTAAAANEQVIRDTQYTNEVNTLKGKYLQELAEAEGNERKIAEIKKMYEEQNTQMTEQYAIKTAQAQYDLVLRQMESIGVFGDEFNELTTRIKDGEIEAATQILEAYGLTHEKALELIKALCDAEVDVTTATTDAMVSQTERENEATQEAAQNEQEAHQKRMEHIQDWVQKAGEAIEKLSDLFSAMYDAQIDKIEEALEAEQERYDKEVSQIEDLAERDVITKDEAEIRKREAERRTAAEQEKLEKKKAQLQYKQAVLEKANSIAQIGISTALGIMQTYAQLGWPAGIPGAIFVGAMGAIQLATALAQPIKAYKEGTKGRPHPGGLALVGDGDKAELVMYNGKAWVTPDKPTLLDLPRGAEVYPDAEKMSLERMGAMVHANIPYDRVTGQPVIINDYRALESRVAANTKAVTRALRDHQNALTYQLKRQKFNAYIARRT